MTPIAPVIPGPTTPADFRPFVSPFDRFNFGPFNFPQIPLERYGVFANFRYEAADDINFSAKGIWNERKSKTRPRPGRSELAPDSGLTPVLSAITISATNPFNPFGVLTQGAMIR